MRVVTLVGKSYSTICLGDLCSLLGQSETQVTQCKQGKGEGRGGEGEGRGGRGEGRERGGEGRRGEERGGRGRGEGRGGEERRGEGEGYEVHCMYMYLCMYSVVMCNR